MAKAIRLLTALLAVQIALAVGLAFTGPSLSAPGSGKPLIDLGKAGVDRITIEAPKQDKIVLAKVKGTWQLPTEGGFPADADHVTRLLGLIRNLKPVQPVATTAGARTRFKVAATDFERRITLAAGGKTLGTLYVGTAPAMHQTHVRVDGQNAIYAVDLQTYDVPSKISEWQNDSVLQIPAQDITGIDVDGLALTRPAPGAHAMTPPAKPAGHGKPADQAQPVAPTWHAEHLARGENLDATAVDKLVAQLAGLRVGKVLGTAAQPDYGLAKPVLQLTVTRKDGKQVQYALGKMTQGADYVLKSSLRGDYFALPSYTAQDLIDGAKRDALIPPPKKAAKKVTDHHRHKHRR